MRGNDVCVCAQLPALSPLHFRCTGASAPSLTRRTALPAQEQQLCLSSTGTCTSYTLLHLIHGTLFPCVHGAVCDRAVSSSGFGFRPLPSCACDKHLCCAQ